MQPKKPEDYSKFLLGLGFLVFLLFFLFFGILVDFDCFYG